MVNCTDFRDRFEDEELGSGEGERRQPWRDEHRPWFAGALERVTDGQVAVDTHRRQDERRAGQRHYLDVQDQLAQQRSEDPRLRDDEPPRGSLCVPRTTSWVGRHGLGSRMTSYFVTPTRPVHVRGPTPCRTLQTVPAAATTATAFWVVFTVHFEFRHQPFHLRPAISALQFLKSGTLPPSLRMFIAPNTPSSFQEPLLRAGLPTHLASFFLRLRFGFCRPLSAFRYYTYLLTYFHSLAKVRWTEHVHPSPAQSTPWRRPWFVVATQDIGTVLRWRSSRYRQPYLSSELVEFATEKGLVLKGDSYIRPEPRCYCRGERVS